MNKSTINPNKLNKSQGKVLPDTLPDFGMKGRSFFLPFHLILDIPKNTAIASPLEVIITLPIGRINRLWIEVPDGVSGLAGVQLWRGDRQIFPLPAGTWFTGNNFFNVLSFTHILFTNPLQIKGIGYNLDDTYKHKITFIMEMSGNEEDLPANFQSFLDTLKG